jgi:p-hydroxybenzoate 3-monooxygenase
VPPTGAKGLNLALGDVGLLADALIAGRRGDPAPLEGYSAAALARVWQAVRFSWWFTALTHRFDDPTGLERRLQAAEFEQIRRSRAAQALLAEGYAGLNRG